MPSDRQPFKAKLGRLPRFVIHKADLQIPAFNFFYWTLHAPNNRIICTSETLSTRRNAVRSARSAARNVANALGLTVPQQWLRQLVC